MLPTCHRAISKYLTAAGRGLVGSWEAVVGAGRLQDGDLQSADSRAPECGHLPHKIVIMVFLIAPE